MRKLYLITSAIILCGILTSHLPLPSRAAIPGNLPNRSILQASPRNDNLVNNRPHPIDASGPSCANPKPDLVAQCSELERQILASTVRLIWHRRIVNEDGRGYTYGEGNSGYATLKDGRYLVTHNHPGMSVTNLKKGEYITLSVYTTEGKPIWVEGPLAAVTIAIEDAETLVLDFGSYSGEGLFGSLGLVSAEFKTWDSLALQPGLEVAQINWNGTTAHIDWVTIEDVVTESSTPRLELNNFAASGASGGGVFWNGYHVANTESRVTVTDLNSGAVLHQYSVAALNTSQVAGQLR